MNEIKSLPSVYYPRKPVMVDDPPYKELTPCTQAELDALLRIGWQLEKPKVAP